MAVAADHTIGQTGAVVRGPLPPGRVRRSAGIEPTDDLIVELHRALSP